MAKSVLELAVGTGQWDAGLKKAKSALDNFTQANGGLQQALDKESQKMQQFVRMMGQMDSTAKTAKGQMNDYKSTIEQLTMQYNRMTDAQKEAIGQDYLQAIDQMKQKYQAVNNEIQEMNRSLSGVSSPAGGGGGLFSGDKISGMLQVFGGNLMTKAAGMAAGFATELGDAVKQGMELAKQGEGIRIAFERLGRGDILQGLREATHGTVTDLELMKAAVKFNDFKLPLDQLGDMLAFAQQKAKDTGQSVDYMVESITNGLGRQSKPILDNLGISAKEIEERMKSTGDFTKAVGEIIREQMAKAGDYVETAADRAAQANVSLQNKMEELGRKFAPVEEASSQLWTSMKIGILDIIGGPLATLINQLTEAGRLKNMLNSMNGESGSGNTKVDQQLKKLKVIKAGGGSDYIFNATLGGMVEDYNRQIMAIDAQVKNGGKPVGGGSGSSQDIRYLQRQMEALKIMRDQLQSGAKDILNPVAAISSVVGGSGSGSGGDKSDKGGSTKAVQTEMQTLQKQIQELEQEYIKLGGITTEDANKRRSEIQSEIAANETRINQIKLLGEQAHGKLMGGSVSTEGIKMGSFAFDGESLQKNLDYVLDQIKVKPIVVPLETTKNNIEGITKAAKTTAQVVGTIGQAFNAIEDPAAKVAAVVAQAIANVALAYSQALAKDVGSKFNIFGFIAASASAMISMATTIASIHQATGYAEGGIVKGNSYSGDNMMFGGDGLYGLNAGELVLTKAQQGSLAQSLQNGGGQTVRVVGKLAGKDLFICAENWAKSAGKGEFVTW